MKKRVLSIILLSLMIFSFASCSFKSSGTVREDYPITFGNVKLEDTPKRAVVLSDNIADIIYACGYERYIVGISDECTQEELRKIDKVGSVNNPDFDKIKSLSADIIILDNTPSDSILNSIRETNIPFLIMSKASDENSLISLYESVASIFGGKITGKSKGNKTITNIIKNMQEINSEIPDSDVVTTICYIYDTEGKAVTGDSFISNVLEYTDTINIFNNNTDGLYVKESLKLADPTYIICDVGVKEQLTNDELLKNLTALRENKVLEISADEISRQGRCMLQNITKIVYFIYPELDNSSEDNNIPEKDNISNNNSTVISDYNITDNTVLKNGDESDLVLKMQNRLNELGYNINNPTGKFDNNTEEALKNFQLLNNYRTTGIATAEILRLIFSDSAVKYTELN